MIIVVSSPGRLPRALQSALGPASRNGDLTRSGAENWVVSGDRVWQGNTVWCMLRLSANQRNLKPMSETADWKQKYRDALLEAEADEKQWREVERVLRRLIGRLCAAGMGVDRQLDEELTVLAAANRRNADAAELE